MKTGYLKKDRMERFNMKRGCFVASKLGSEVDVPDELTS